MFVSEESPIKTKTFRIDRMSYARAKILVALGQVGIMAVFAWLMLVALYFLTFSMPEVHQWATYAVFGTLAFYVSILLIILGRIYHPSIKNLCDLDRTLHFCEDWIFIEARDLAETKAKWAIITKITRSSGWTFLMQGNITAIAIPDSAFSGDDLELFQALIARKTKKS